MACKEEFASGLAARINDEALGSMRAAVQFTNATEYGLADYMYARDLNRGFRMGELLDTDILGLNSGVISNPAAPFGGVKQSGVGRKDGLEGIDAYMSTIIWQTSSTASTITRSTGWMTCYRGIGRRAHSQVA